MYYYLEMKKVTLLGAIFLVAGFYAHAQNYKLRTVVVYSFTRYIHWPEDYEAGDFEIKVLGDSPFTEELQNMAKIKKVGERKISVTKVDGVSEIGKCHILIIPSSQSPHLAEVLQEVGSQATLVVTEEPGLGVKGSDVNFVDKDGKLAFELNQAQLNKKKLKVSTELTRLAILI